MSNASHQRSGIAIGAISIRRAVADDASEMADVHARSWQATYRKLLPDEVIQHVVDGRTARANHMRAALIDANQPHHMFVALADETVVGVAVTGPSRDPMRLRRRASWGPSTWRLREWAVASVARSMGKRWTTCEQPASPKPRSGSARERRARRFYEAAGWVEDGMTKEEKRPGGTLHEVRYRIALTSPTARLSAEA